MKGAIFDLDGTLLDSMKFWGKIADIFLERRNKKLEPSDKKIIDEMTVVNASEFLKNTYNLPETPDKITEEIYHIIESNYKFNIPLKPYVHHFLDKLKKKGVKMCIATATDKYLVEYALDRLSITDMFEFIITSKDVGDGKNESARIYETALEMLGTKKENTVVFEDAYHAVKTAKEAGFYVVGVQDGYFKNQRDEIKELSDVYIKNFREYKI